MNRRLEWAGMVLFTLGILATAGNLVLSRGHPEEIADARLTGAVLAAGLAVVGAIVAATAHLSLRNKPQQKAWPSVGELIPLILIALGLLGISNIIGWWYATGDITGGLLSIGVDAIVLAIGVILLRRASMRERGPGKQLN